MVKKSNRFLVIGILSLFVFIAIVSGIIAASSVAPSLKYNAVPLGHGGDKVYVSYQGNSASTLDDAIANMNARLAALNVVAPPARDSNGCIISSEKWCGASNSCIAQSATCSAIIEPVTFDFLVRVDSGTGITSQEACPAGYDWVGHIHGRLSSGLAMDSFESGNNRQTSDGWMSLCTKTTSRSQKDITTVITSNSCGGSVSGNSCPAGYTQMGSITRSTGQCATDEPQLGDDTRDSGLAVNMGTLIVCQKGAPEYSIKTGTDLCGSDLTLGHVVKTSGNGAAGLFSFCKTN